jgi:hypothetical protein
MNINLLSLFENISLKYSDLIQLNDRDIIYFISDYDKIKYYNQYDKNCCLPIVLNYLVMYLSYQNQNNLDLHNIYDPLDLFDYIYTIRNTNNENSNGSNLYYLLYVFNNIEKFKNIDNLNDKIQTQIVMVKLNWDIIRYYLLNNVPIGTTINIGFFNKSTIDISTNKLHSVVIYGFNNKNTSLYIGPFYSNINSTYIDDISSKFIEIKYDLFSGICQQMFVIKKI